MELHGPITTGPRFTFLLLETKLKCVDILFLENIMDTYTCTCIEAT